MMQPYPEDEHGQMYKERFKGMIGILHPQGLGGIPEDLIEETLWSPYANKYEIRHGDGIGSYTAWDNDILLSRVDEGKVIIK